MNKKSTGLDWYYSKSFWKLEFQATNSMTTCCLFILPHFNSFEKDPLVFIPKCLYDLSIVKMESPLTAIVSN